MNDPSDAHHKDQSAERDVFEAMYIAQSIIHSTTALCIATDSTATSLEQMGAWQYSTKDEMKQLGASLSLTGEKFRELLILGIAKLVEDTCNQIGELKGIKVSFWDPDFCGLAHCKEVRWIRHVANVIKHNGSLVQLSSESTSCLALINKFGVRDETPVSDLPEFRFRPLREAMIPFIYYAHDFSVSLLEHFRVFPLRCGRKKPDNIVDYMLETFVHCLPGHPAKAPAKGAQNP